MSSSAAWECTACTYQNPNFDYLSCEVCGTCRDGKPTHDASFEVAESDDEQSGSQGLLPSKFARSPTNDRNQSPSVIVVETPLNDARPVSGALRAASSYLQTVESKHVQPSGSPSSDVPHESPMTEPESPIRFKRLRKRKRPALGSPVEPVNISSDEAADAEMSNVEVNCTGARPAAARGSPVHDGVDNVEIDGDIVNLNEVESDEDEAERDVSRVRLALLHAHWWQVLDTYCSSRLVAGFRQMPGSRGNHDK